MTPWASDLESDLRRLDELSLRRSILTPETGPEPHVFMQGRQYTLFTPNNYLGLSTHPEVIEASIEATPRLWDQRLVLPAAVRVHPAPRRARSPVGRVEIAGGMSAF